MPPAPETTGATAVQEELARRRRRYLETVVRRVNVKHGGWEEEAGWTDADRNRFKQVGKDGKVEDLDSAMSYSVCDVFRFQPPPVVADEDLDVHPVAPPDQDDS